MRSSPLAFTIVGLVLALCFCSGCLFDSSSSPETTAIPTQTMPVGINGGLSQIKDSARSVPVNFSYAVSHLRNEMKSYSDAVGTIHIFYIQGKGLNDAGNADAWLFGVSHSSEDTILIFDGVSWDSIPYQETIPSDEINVSAIIPPEELLRMNKDTIQSALPAGATTTKDLVLSQGMYTLKVSSGGTTRIMKFDASTGALIA